ncbi:acyl-CoA carboxylase subunit epsilon [Kribbella sp. NPDC056861]|jgi:hypothetical protein|uniref:acyl-CoA carboxylase subunit epsilon n=1 Tax=Kribbella sp. NPDC056861 TaxID=3154857 RepID=UPI003428AE1B
MTDPVLRIAKGDPTPEELAALIAVVSARAAATPAATSGPTTASNWASYWRNHTRPLHPGPGRWKASAHP